MTPIEPQSSTTTTREKDKPRVCVCPQCMSMFVGTRDTPITQKCDKCDSIKVMYTNPTAPTFVVKDLNFVDTDSKQRTEGSFCYSSLNNSNNDNP